MKKGTGVFSTISLGIGAGLLGGGLAGFLEGLTVSLMSLSGYEFRAIPWGAFFYGMAGAEGGFGLGIALWLWSRIRGGFDARAAFAVAFVAVFIPVVTIIARFRIRRDVFHEQPLSLSMNGIILLCALVLAVLLFLLLARSGAFSRPVVWLSRLRGAAAAFVLLIAVAAGAAAGMKLVLGPRPPEPPSVAEGKAPPNIILIAIDTLRADYLPIHGGRGIRTPALNRLAHEGIVFENAITQSSWTKPSFASIFTSMLPSTHTTVFKSSKLPDDAVTIAEVLFDRGYMTVGLANNTNIGPLFNFQQGFVTYRYLRPGYLLGASDSASRLVLYEVLRRVNARFGSRSSRVEDYYRDAATVNEKSMEALRERRPQPLFMFIHYMDPHDPYFPRTAGQPGGRGYARAEHQNPDPSDTEMMDALYRGEIEYLDDHLGELFHFLRKKGLYDDSAIILTSDHGEEFYEHKGFWHGTTLYEEQIHVPLIVKLPRGKHAGRRVRGLVRSLDIAPTIAELASAERPEGWQGTSLLPSIETSASLLEEVYSEENHEGNILQSIRTQKLKLIEANPGNPRGLAEEEVYDLSKDPGEQRNLAGAVDASKLRGSMLRLATIARKLGLQAASAVLTAEECECLRALGYVVGDECPQ